MERPIRDVIEADDRETLKSMLEANPSATIHSTNDDDAILCAAGNNKSAIVQLLIDYGADANTCDDEGRTALHRAAELGPESVQVLLENGADPNRMDHLGYTPLAWAIHGQQPEGEESARILREGGAEYDLLAATAMGDIGTVRSILDRQGSAAIKPGSEQALLSLVWTVGAFGNRSDRVQILRELLANGLRLDKPTLLKHAKAAETAGRGEFAAVLRAQAENQTS